MTAGSSKALNDNDKSSSATPASGKERKMARSATPFEWAALACIFFLTYVLVPHPLHPEGQPSLQHVFYYGWLTAVSTGLGIVPLIFAPDLASYWVGVSNGMLRMLFPCSRFVVVVSSSTYDPQLEPSMNLSISRGGWNDDSSKYIALLGRHYFH